MRMRTQMLLVWVSLVVGFALAAAIWEEPGLPPGSLCCLAGNVEQGSAANGPNEAHGSAHKVGIPAHKWVYQLIRAYSGECRASEGTRIVAILLPHSFAVDFHWIFMQHHYIL